MVIFQEISKTLRKSPIRSMKTSTKVFRCDTVKDL